MATIDHVSVTLGRDDDQKFVVKVQVLSQKKPGLRANVELDPGKCQNNAEFLKLLQAAAGACAEYLGKYGDNIDPANCTKLVLEAFTVEARMTKALTQDAGLKMKAIGDNLSRLPNKHLEVYRAISWRMKQPGYLTTPKEIKWMDDRIREVFR